MLLNRRAVAALLLGFASGLPLALSGATLQAWLASEGASLKSIAWFSLAGMPYAWKFLWSPLMDRYAPPWLGRRRGWMLLLQLALAAVLAAMALTEVPAALPRLAVLAILLAFLSASQDIVIDAWRTEVMPPRERGVAAGASVLGYRLGMLVAGALALILAPSLGWRTVFLGLAAIMLVQPLVTVWAPDAGPERGAQAPATLRDALYGPWRDFLQRDRAVAMLCLIVAYKLSDAFQLALSTAFLLRGPGFSLEEVGLVNKGVALGASLLGVAAGGFGLARLGLVRALLLFGVLQCSTSFGFLALAVRGHDFPLMVAAVTFENLASGMGTAAFAALLMGLCSARYSATQFALLSALAAIGRVYVGPTSGMLVERFGWARFFVLAAFTGVPGLLLVWRLREQIARLEALPVADPSLHPDQESSA